MSQRDSISVIHRKARVGRKDFDARAMSPSKALRLALAKSADQLYDFALTASMVEHHGLVAAALPERLGDDGLLVLLDGAHGLRGAVKMETQFVAALIEAQIIGEVRHAEARARAYTRTDAAMTAPFLDSVMAEFDMQMKAHVSGYNALSLRFGDRVEDARLLGLALDGGTFDMFDITADLGGGAKTGVITVLLPKRPIPEASQRETITGRTPVADTLKRNVLDATAVLDAVLARIQLPLREICNLAPGMTLSIPHEALQQAELYAPMRQLVGDVRLGQLNGFRAVRMTCDEPSSGATPSGPDHPRDNPTPVPEMQVIADGAADGARPVPEGREPRLPAPDAEQGAGLLSAAP